MSSLIPEDVAAGKVLGRLLVPLFAWVGALWLLGYSAASSSAHGTETTHGFVWTVLHENPLAQILGLAAKAIRSVVSHFAKAQLGMMGNWFEDLGSLALGYFIGLPVLAEALVGALERIETRGDPQARKKANGAQHTATHAGKTATKAQGTASNALTHTEINAKALNSYKATTNAKIKTINHSIAVTIPNEIGGIRTREKTLEGEYADLRARTKAIEDGAVKTWDWIKAHPVGVAATAFAGAVAIALDRLGLGGIKCPAFGNLFNKRGCGMWNILDDVLGLLADVLLFEAICEWLPEVESLFGAFEAPLVSLISTAASGACSHPPSGWNALGTPALYLPSGSQVAGTL